VNGRSSSPRRCLEPSASMALIWQKKMGGLLKLARGQMFLAKKDALS